MAILLEEVEKSVAHFYSRPLYFILRRRGGRGRHFDLREGVWPEGRDGVVARDGGGGGVEGQSP